VKRLSTTETAAEVRKALKAAFPTIKFSVRSKSYSMGSSITVSYTDGPIQSQVQAILDGFEGAGFDGSQDLKYQKEPAELNGELVRFGADYVNASRTISAELYKQAAREVAFETELPLLRVVTEGRHSHIEGGNYQVPFRLHPSDNTIVHDAIQGEWYEQLVYQFARSISCIEPKPVQLPTRVDQQFIDAKVESMLQ
jgi:hypothetical protein